MIPKNVFNLKEHQLKLIKNLLALGLFGVILILAGSIFSDILAPTHQEAHDEGDDELVSIEKTMGRTAGDLRYDEEVRARLERILTQVEGVGNVSVEIFFESGPEYKYAYNERIDQTESQEEDSSGGIRRVSELSTDREIVIVSDGNEKPILVQEMQPEVRGVLVVAQGANNGIIRMRLVNAIEAVLGIPPHKIQVLPGK